MFCKLKMAKICLLIDVEIILTFFSLFLNLDIILSIPMGEFKEKHKRNIEKKGIIQFLSFNYF